MAGPMLGGGGGRSRGRRKNYVAMSDINVTPFVDVMLVLLIVFMVATPLITQGIKVDLPKVDAETVEEDDELQLGADERRHAGIGKAIDLASKHLAR